MSVANTETIPTSQTNGVIEDYDEEEKMKMRPADIDADMREMERRKRVELIMNSRLFREELERIIESQIKDGHSSAGLLQQISEMVGSKYNNHLFKSSNCAVPINDIRGVEAMGYAKGEKILRCKLAALFRLIDLYGWSQGIYNHITARLSQQEEHFLVNPYGLLYNEVTASSLVKVDMQGNVIETGTTNFAVNVSGFQLHAAVYAARPDLKCIVHLHTPSVLAVSSLKDHLLPLCQEAAVIGDISQHVYVGTPNDLEERDKIARNLGPNNKVMFLTNHGALCCGETIEEAFFNVYNTVSACETQLKIMPLGRESMLLLSEETRKVMYDAARKLPENILSPPSNISAAAANIAEKRCRIGALEFEALMRMLDNAGFRTGYLYRQPLIKGELPRPRNDVEVPPAVSSLGYLLEEEEMYKQGQWKKLLGAKGSDRIRWLNSPNVYQKVEILETGTSDPKKITKWVDANNEEWVADGSPSHTSTPVRIEHALQFVPKNTNPKEFKKLQQQIKDNRRADKITSGPQSHILEGVSWEEAKKLQDANVSNNGDQVILVGAASKGIIQREYQHNATVYKTPYAKNPFDQVTDEELENYKKDITRKQRGESYYDEDESDALSSSLPPSGRNAAGVTSETEDDSLAHDMRIIQIKKSTVPKASQAEVVLSDDIKKENSNFSNHKGSTSSLKKGKLNCWKNCTSRSHRGAQNCSGAATATVCQTEYFKKRNNKYYDDHVDDLIIVSKNEYVEPKRYSLISRIHKIPKLQPMLCVIAIVRTSSFPIESKAYLSTIINVENAVSTTTIMDKCCANVDQRRRLLYYDLDDILRVFCGKKSNYRYVKKMKKMLSDELRMKLQLGELRTVSPMFSLQCTVEDDDDDDDDDDTASLPPLPPYMTDDSAELKHVQQAKGFDSSEMEYTTFIEIPYRDNDCLDGNKNLSPNSIADFSSVPTTEDEEDEMSPNNVDRRQSLSSISSYIGVEYEETKPPHLELSPYTQDPLSTMLMSSISDDTNASFDNLTVIYRPTKAEIEADNMKKNTSEGDCDSYLDEFEKCCDGTFSSFSDEELPSDVLSNTYSRLSDDYDMYDEENLDYDVDDDNDDLSPVLSPLNGSLLNDAARYKSELSVIMEEDTLDQTYNIDGISSAGEKENGDDSGVMWSEDHIVSGCVTANKDSADCNGECAAEQRCCVEKCEEIIEQYDVNVRCNDGLNISLRYKIIDAGDESTSSSNLCDTDKENKIKCQRLFWRGHIDSRFENRTFI